MHTGDTPVTARAEPEPCDSFYSLACSARGRDSFYSLAFASLFTGMLTGAAVCLLHRPCEPVYSLALWRGILSFASPYEPVPLAGFSIQCMARVRGGYQYGTVTVLCPERPGDMSGTDGLKVPTAPRR